MHVNNMLTEPGKVLCFGYGYVARRLAQRLLPCGWQIAGTSRSPAEGIYPFDATVPLPSGAWHGVTHLLHSIPPDASGDVVLRRYGASLPDLAWVGYLSATSVYGDTHGAWVAEDAPTNPPTERGMRRLAAERAWLEQWERRGVPVHIFRLSGIYGPGRNALAEALAGTARRVFREGQVFSRIHVEDIAAALEASIRAPAPGSIYNLADNMPAPAWEVVEYACALLGMEPPPLVPLEQADLSPMARSFYEASRRVDNRKLREELGVRLRYPDYRAGLAALLEEEKARHLHTVSLHTMASHNQAPSHEE